MSDVREFKLGRQAATHPVGYKLIDRYVSSIPAAPATFDHTNGFNAFRMLGNGPDPSLTVNDGNPVGDCAWVGTANVTIVDQVETKETLTFPTSDELVGDYLKYNHGQDVGANLSELLAYWTKVGLPWAGKLAGYAGLNFRDWDSFWAGVNAFGNGYIGIVVTETMMNQTQAGEPWDVTGLESDNNVLGGHCVVAFAKDGDLGTVATWGQRQQFTQAWFEACMEEAHVCLTPAQVKRGGDGYGVDLAHLRADLKALAA